MADRSRCTKWPRRSYGPDGVVDRCRWLSSCSARCSGFCPFNVHSLCNLKAFPTMSEAAINARRFGGYEGLFCVSPTLTTALSWALTEIAHVSQTHTNTHVQTNHLPSLPPQIYFSIILLSELLDIKNCLGFTKCQTERKVHFRQTLSLEHFCT